MKYFIFLLLSCIFCTVKSQYLYCRKDTLINNSNKVEYLFDKKDSTCSIKVKISNISYIKKGFYYDINECSFVPLFIMKFKNNFIFLSGTHQHYRIITLFQLNGERIHVDEFENELMLESSIDGYEKLLWLDNGNPNIVYIGNDNKPSIKIYKYRCQFDKKNIKSFVIFSNKIDVIFKNKKIKTLMLNDFKSIY